MDGKLLSSQQQFMHMAGMAQLRFYQILMFLLIFQKLEDNTCSKMKSASA